MSVRPPGGAEFREDLRLLLPPWLVRQRWFAGKQQQALPTLDQVHVTALGPGHPALFQVTVGCGPGEWYQLLVGVGDMPPGVPTEARIGRGAGPLTGEFDYYEATADPELMGRLLELLAGADGQGPVELRRTPGCVIPLGLTAEVSRAEQSNTSVMFGRTLVLKVLRRLVVGDSPELELLGALHRAEGVRSADLMAWMQLSSDVLGAPVTLAILQEFIPSRGDGWGMAVEQARDWITATPRPDRPGLPFTTESRGLGRATAEVHAALAAQLSTRTPTAAEADDLVASAVARLESALADVPQLRPYEQRLRAIQRDLGEAVRHPGALPVQRVHGDLHLGQALRAESGWVLIDFEGEPGRTPEERRRLHPALRDVASMLRSFDYAAQQAMAAGPATGPSREAQERRAADWVGRNRRAFCAGYTAARGADPERHPAVVRAFEADKAVYEAVYEAHNRPAWLPIPLRAIDRLTASPLAGPTLTGAGRP
ncbi:maltokinase N-terminal cap-like domain-containing protein [Streptacidiphilus fuscans]|uniref:Maltokinase n=1 Tax=Streptacidiphilus fuscans TaxID=2789292 RepID=A0A931B3Z1_9ACTN|nr:maltokinase [Streptacidiphilus fuscans]MBF9070780.1 maltokinase [Streptacidiphilus fuscans]